MQQKGLLVLIILSCATGTRIDRRFRGMGDVVRHVDDALGKVAGIGHHPLGIGAGAAQGEYRSDQE